MTNNEPPDPPDTTLPPDQRDRNLDGIAGARLALTAARQQRHDDRPPSGNLWTVNRPEDP